MNTILFTIATLLGLSISVLVMSILFAVTMGSINAAVYVMIGSLIGVVSGLSVYWLLSNVK